MDYLVVGPAIINDIVYEDGRRLNQILGGAIYCLAGIKVWSDDVLFVTNVGSDFGDYYGKWMKDNQMSEAGLAYVLPRTWYTTLIYGAAGLHDEVSVYDDDIDALQSLNDVINAEQIAKLCDASTKGIYIEASESAPVWQELSAIRERTAAKIMWELPTSATMDPSRKSAVLETIQYTDMLSINLPEALSLFGVETEAEAIKALQALHKPCLFRVGKKGSYMIGFEHCAFAPSVTLGAVIDATGCGNVATATAMYAYCEGRSLEECARMANISAAFNLLQYGPYPQINANVRGQAEALLRG